MIISCVIFIILFFPIFINFDVFCEPKKNKFAFNSTLFGFIKILKGKIKLTNEGIIFIFSNKKQKVIFYNKLFNFRNKVKTIKDFHLVSFNSLIEVNYEKNDLSALSACFIYSFILREIKWFFYHKKPYLNLDNKITYLNEKNALKVSIYATALVNIFIVLINIIKYFWGKLFNANGKKMRKI